MRYPWASLPVLGLLALSAGLWVLFTWRLMTAPEPLVPLAVMANPVVGTATAAAFCGMGVFIGLSIYVPVYLEVVVGFTAGNSGLALMPLMVGTVTGANLSGRLMSTRLHYKRTPLVGLALAAAALAALAAMPTGLPIWAVEVLLLVIGLGIGTLLPVSTISIQNAVLPHQMGTATASMNFFRSLGGAIVVAGFGAIILGSATAGPGLSAEMMGAASAGTADLAPAFGWLFAGAALGTVASLVFLAAMEERPLRSGAAAHAKEAIVE